MKIIQKGKSKWSKRITCKGCDAVLEVEPDDIEYVVTDAHTQVQQYEKDIEGDFLVSCPECGQITKIRDIPEGIKENIKSNF